MTAFPKDKSMLLIAINMVTRPYADTAATTQETVSWVASMIWAPLMTMGSFLGLPAQGTVLNSTTLLRFNSTNAWEMEDRAWRGCPLRQTDSASVFLALKVKPQVQVRSWHTTATINSSSALGNNRIGPKRLAESSIADISGTKAATLWSKALACNVSENKIPAKRLGTDEWALACTRVGLSVEFPLRKRPCNTVFVHKEGYPYYFVWFGFLLFPLWSRFSHIHPCNAWQANCDIFLCQPTKTSDFVQSAVWFWAHNLLNRDDMTVLGGQMMVLGTRSSCSC